jgi:hypothetical protein
MPPADLEFVVFCIIVIAGEVNEADIKVFNVIIVIENQKFYVTRQQRAVSGNAIALLTIQTYDFAIRFFFSNISLIIPPASDDIRPPIANEAAFRTAN